ncbi:MAG: ImmA/IrrE family metallo-endopeptidase [Hyphomicrobiales bacterium]|nr:ImmA/IrrE family metallo-endopeptidase [Hyphomicrobiales bacterium]MCC2106717.1 ImmA/IrrE family metallo-endopeptidase [Hyphomicrobiales bacterium]
MTVLKPSYLRVRRRAEEALQDLTQPPVDVMAVAARLGAEVRPFDLSADVSGILYREGDRRVIVVNQHHSVARQRFTIAHEIGHLALHKGEAVHVDEKFPIYFRDGRSTTAENVLEIEANAFAANLLMPADWLRADLDSMRIDFSDDEALVRLADRYQVSTQAMALRLASLALI